MILSEPFSVLDSIYYDDCSTNLNQNKYSISSSMSISHSNEKYTVQCGSDYRRLNLFADSTLLNQLKGKTIRFKCDMESDYYIEIAIYLNGSRIAYKNSSRTAILETDGVNIPSDISSAYFQLVGTVNESFSFKDFCIYPI